MKVMVHLLLGILINYIIKRDKDKILFATRRKTYKNIAMIAGGTGITPML
jgi:hypothetical protein